MNNLFLLDDNIQLLGALIAVIGEQLKDRNILTARNGRGGIAKMDSQPVA